MLDVSAPVTLNLIRIYELDPYCLDVQIWTSYIKAFESYCLADRQANRQNLPKL